MSYPLPMNYDDWIEENGSEYEDEDGHIDHELAREYYRDYLREWHRTKQDYEDTMADEEYHRRKEADL